MPSVKVRTSQNVFIEYPIAGVGDRVAAHLIDVVIKIAYVVLVLYSVDQISNPDDWVFIVMWIPIVFYSLGFELLMNGQSPGKIALNIKVIQLDGSRPGVVAYFLRWIFRMIDIWPFQGLVAFLFVILSDKGQRLGDLAAGTTVIKMVRSDRLDNSPLSQEFAEEYKPVFNEVIRLSDQEIDLIDRALDFNRKEGNPGPANLLAEKLAAKMGVKLDMPPLNFLYTVKRDYNHITSR